MSYPDVMKLTKKNTRSFVIIVILSMIVGALSWKILEAVTSVWGIDFTLSTGKIGFDLDVISFFFEVNPGTILGAIAGIFIFKGL